MSAAQSPVSSPAEPVVWILYGSEKGDLSYTDAANRGLSRAQQEWGITTREFVPGDLEALPSLLNATTGSERPGLFITVGFQYADLTRQLAAQHPDIRFLAIDQSMEGSGNLQAYEITSYGDSFLAGAVAASSSATGRVGIIMGMRSPLLDTFIRGYTDGARAADPSVAVDQAYVHEDSVEGFMDPDEAGRIAETMYRNGTDVIFTGAGISNTGVFDRARDATGRYAIGTDTDQSPLGPRFIIASAVKRVDHVVYTGIAGFRNGTFSGGTRVAGLAEGATGIVCNPAFPSCNATVSAWQERAARGEQEYLASR